MLGIRYRLKTSEFEPNWHRWCIVDSLNGLLRLKRERGGKKKEHTHRERHKCHVHLTLHSILTVGYTWNIFIISYSLVRLIYFVQVVIALRTFLNKTTDVLNFSKKIVLISQLIYLIEQFFFFQIHFLKIDAQLIKWKGIIGHFFVQKKNVY